jgi:hypothetical protein
MFIMNFWDWIFCRKNKDTQNLWTVLNAMLRTINRMEERVKELEEIIQSLAQARAQAQILLAMPKMKLTPMMAQSPAPKNVVIPKGTAEIAGKTIIMPRPKYDKKKTG